MNEQNKPEMEVRIDGEVLEMDSVEALEVVDRAAINQQIATAKQYPRAVTKALLEAETLATMDEDTAASMFYVIPRGGKNIQGPSVRLAEVMAYSWRNLRAEADIIAEDSKFITAMGTCMDLERNVGVRVRVKRKITDRSGHKYSPDMVGVTANAACSIALRNAVFRVIPAVFVNQLYEKARQASIGGVATIEQKRANALEWFTSSLGLKEEQVFAMIDVAGLDDIGSEELIALRGIRTALKDGEVNIDTLLAKGNTPTEGASALNDDLQTQTQEKKPATKSSSPQQAEQMRAPRDTAKRKPQAEEPAPQAAPPKDGNLI